MNHYFTENFNSAFFFQYKFYRDSITLTKTYSFGKLYVWLNIINITI